MLLVLSEEHKLHLGFLAQVDVEGALISLSQHCMCLSAYCKSVFAVVKEFCKISLEFIKKGTNPKLYQSAGRECDFSTVHTRTH